MAALTEKDRRYLRQMAWMQPGALITGILGFVLGVAYVAWAVLIFDFRQDPREQGAFDVPIQEIADVYDGYSWTISKIIPESDTEAILLESMRGGLKFTTGIMVMLLRIFLGTLVALMGLVSLTVVVERRRLLHVIDRLQAPDAIAPADGRPV